MYPYILKITFVKYIVFNCNACYTWSIKSKPLGHCCILSRTRFLYIQRTWAAHGLRLTKQLATNFLRSCPLFQLDTIVANHGFESTSFVRIVHTLVTDEWPDTSKHTDNMGSFYETEEIYDFVTSSFVKRCPAINRFITMCDNAFVF